METRKTISIVTPCLNAADTIERHAARDGDARLLQIAELLEDRLQHLGEVLGVGGGVQIDDAGVGERLVSRVQPLLQGQPAGVERAAAARRVVELELRRQ